MSLPASIRNSCARLLPAPILRVERVGGGDINEACRLTTDQGSFFLKHNQKPEAASMLEDEARGLELLRQAGTVRIPEVVGSGKTEDGAFLLMEFIDSGRASREGWQAFGRALARLHARPQPYFGLDHDNWIGSLHQGNQACQSFISFYIEQRLQPQLDMALRANRLNQTDAEGFEKLYAALPHRLPNEPPALIHGDLWSGNYLFDPHGQAVLIDPAVAYAHREMDLAMSKLFGGFDTAFYQAYHHTYPLEADWEDRMEIYQLYYLLVHVNLFGGGYAGSVRRILHRHTG